MSWHNTRSGLASRMALVKASDQYTIQTMGTSAAAGIFDDVRSPSSQGLLDADASHVAGSAYYLVSTCTGPPENLSCSAVHP